MGMFSKLFGPRVKAGKLVDELEETTDRLKVPLATLEKSDPKIFRRIRTLAREAFSALKKVEDSIIQEKDPNRRKKILSEVHQWRIDVKKATAGIKL